MDIDLHTQASASLPGIGIDPNRHSLSVAGDNVYFKLGNARVKLGPVSQHSSKRIPAILTKTLN